jgi:hypothetical protein
MISHFEIVCHLDLLSKNSLQRHARIPQPLFFPIRPHAFPHQPRQQILLSHLPNCNPPAQSSHPPSDMPELMGHRFDAADLDMKRRTGFWYNRLARRADSSLVAVVQEKGVYTSL